MPSVEVDHLKWLLAGYGAVLLFIAGIIVTVIGKLVGKRFDVTDHKLDKMDNKLDKYSLDHAACRETLAERFAPKTETDRHFDVLYTSRNDHEKRITTIEKVIDNELIRKIAS
jgi:hypothetical protein